jgi:carbohydrate diacid regulator
VRLTPPVATEIIQRARLVLKRAVLVADERGVILAGNDQEGEIAVDALRACQEGRIIRAVWGEEQIAWCPFVYEHRTIGAFGLIEESIEVTPEAISLLQGLAEVITHQHFLHEHIQPTERVRATFLRQTLTGPAPDASETYRQADILQMNLRIPQAIILIEADDLERKAIGSDLNLPLDEKTTRINEAYTRLRGHILEAFHNHPGNICCYFGGNQLVVSKGIGGEGLTTRNTTRFLIEKAEYIHQVLQQAAKDTVFSMGIGQYYPELGGLRKSYQEAKLALTVGMKVWDHGKTYHIKQVGMFVTLANVAQERKAELAHQILHPLLRDDQLYKTVQTFLQSGLNLTDAAEKLHIHRNTLIYRLDKTKKVIGLDPRVFDDALQIKLGLMFYQEA